MLVDYCEHLVNVVVAVPLDVGVDYGHHLPPLGS